MPYSKCIAADRNLSTEDCIWPSNRRHWEIQTICLGSQENSCKKECSPLSALQSKTSFPCFYSIFCLRLLSLLKNCILFKGAEWIQCSKSMVQSRPNKPFICGFSPFPRFKKYLHTSMTNHLLQLLRPSRPVTPSKSIFSYFTVLNPTQTLTGV